MLKLGFIPTKPSLPFVPRYLPSLSFQPRCFHLHVHVLSLHRYLHLVPAWVPPYLSSCLASLSSPGSSIPLFLPCIAIFTWFLHTSLPALHRYLHLVPPYLSSCLASLSSPGSSIPLPNSHFVFTYSFFLPSVHLPS